MSGIRVNVADCTKCGATLNPTQKFCDGCGSKRATVPINSPKKASPTTTAPSAATKCSKCSTSLTANQKFCDVCGERVFKALTPAASKQPKKKFQPVTSHGRQNQRTPVKHVVRKPVAKNVSSPSGRQTKQNTVTKPETTSAEAEASGKHKCGKCDGDLVPDTKFCEHCGEPVSLWKNVASMKRGRNQPTHRRRVSSEGPKIARTPQPTSTYVSTTLPSSAMSDIANRRKNRNKEAQSTTSSKTTSAKTTSAKTTSAKTTSPKTTTFNLSPRSTKHNPNDGKRKSEFQIRRGMTPKAQQVTARPEPVKRSVSAGPSQKRGWHSRSMPAQRASGGGGLNLNNPVTRLRVWVQMQVEDYPIPPVENFTKSWQDGQTLTALVDSVQPGVCPLSGMIPGQNQQNIQRAMDIAEEKFDVPAIMAAQDMANHPEKKSCMTYVSYYYKLKGAKKPKKKEPQVAKTSPRLSSPQEHSASPFASRGARGGVKSGSTPSNVESSAGGKTCPACKATAPPRFKFCDGCGTRL